MLSNLLKSAGHTSEQAEDGLIAVQKVTPHLPLPFSYPPPLTLCNCLSFMQVKDKIQAGGVYDAILMDFGKHYFPVCTIILHFSLNTLYLLFPLYL